MARKYQQGGVSVYNIPSYPIPQVGGIANSPMINAPLIPQADLSTLLDTTKTADTRQRQYEQDLARQQSQLASEKDKYFAIQDQLFGEVHNEAQRAALKAALAKQGASMEAVLAANDITTVRKEFDNARRALYSPDVQRILGQVEAADRYLQRKGPQNMADDQRTAYKNYADSYFKETDPAKVFDYDPMKLDENYWYSPPAAKAAKPADLTGVVRDNLKYYTNGLDLNNPEQMSQAEQIFAEDLYVKDGARAEELGYIAIDPATNEVVLTPRGSEYYRGKIQLYGMNRDANRQDKMDDFQEKRDYTITHRPPDTGNGTGRGHRTFGSEKADTEVEQGWATLMAVPEIKAAYGDLNPYENRLLYDYIYNTVTTEGSMGVGNVDKYRKIIRSLQNIRNKTNPLTPTDTAAPGAVYSDPVKTSTQTTTTQPTKPVQYDWKLVNGKYVQVPRQ